MEFNMGPQCMFLIGLVHLDAKGGEGSIPGGLRCINYENGAGLAHVYWPDPIGGLAVRKRIH